MLSFRRAIESSMIKAEELPLWDKVEHLKYVLDKMVEDENVPEEVRVGRIINFTALSCALVATQPLPVADIVILTPMQVAMIYGLARAMKVPMRKEDGPEVLATILSVVGWGLLAQHGVIALYKIGIPFLGAVTTIPFVYAATIAIGSVAKVVLKSRQEKVELRKEYLRELWKNSVTQAKAAAARMTIQSMKQELDYLRQLYRESESEKEKLRNKQLKNEEIKPCLIRALENATEEVDIMSPWISPSVVRELDALLDGALKRGVVVKILYGISDLSKGNGPKNDKTEEAVKMLRRRFGKYGSKFRIKNSCAIVNHLGTHGKLLICDDVFYVLSSLNWLSYLNDYRSGGREEIAEYSEDAKGLRHWRDQYFNF